MKRGIRVLAFLLVLAVLYTWMDGVLQTKSSDGIGTMRRYYELPEDTVDVLMVGSSHIGMNIDPVQMYEDYGIAAYSLWGGMQPIWNSYYFVKEGLKYQDPDVVIVEVFLACNTAEISEKSVALKNVQAMKFSLDKVRAAFDSFGTWQEAVEALWGMPTYHERFDEVTESDFNYDEYVAENDLKIINENGVLTTQREPYAIKLNTGITDTLPLSEKSEKYLRKIISLCQAENVQLVLMAAPFEATEDEYRRLNTVEKIAKESGVPFLNYLADAEKHGISPEQDFYDIGHLNAAGIPKLTLALSEYLTQTFQLQDRRSDANHIWAKDGAATVSAAASDAAWRMQEQFSGDGMTRYIDTDLRLYENRYGSWTLLSQIDMNTSGGEDVYFSCFSEEAGVGNFGLLVRKMAEDRLEIKLGNNIGVEVYCQEDLLDLAIVKNVEAYTVYANGELIVKDYELSCAPYTGSLLIGCQELSPDGEKYRFSTTKVMDMEIHMEVLSEAEILGWKAASLPEMPVPMGMDGKIEQIYAMPEQFVGNSGLYAQDAYIDTGLQLYDEAATRFTLLTRLTPGSIDGDEVFFSAFSEVPGEYRGLLVRQVSDTQLNLVLGSNYGVNIDCIAGQPIDIAIVKDLDAYTIYVDGMKVHEITSPCAPYDGTLLIGAQRDAQGNIFRKSGTHVNSLTILSGAMDAAAVQAWDFADAAMPGQRVAASVEYALDNAFLGNGKDRHIDTGVQLFDMSDKDWTMATTIRTDYGTNNGVYLSCFSEEAGQYRGFMLRQEADDSLTLFVGNALTHKIALSETEKIMRLVIVKQGSEYTVYRNGELEANLSSECAGYDGTLLIGCQETADGVPFRFSTAKVDELQLWDGAVSDDEAEAMSVVNTKDSRFE